MKFEFNEFGSMILLMLSWLAVMFAYLTDVTVTCFNRLDNSNGVRKPQCTHLKSVNGLKFMLSIPPQKIPEEV